MKNNEKNLKPNRTIDVIGYFCPEPIFRTRLEIDKMDYGEILEVLADDPTAEKDISLWLKKTKHDLLLLERKNNYIRFLIMKK